MRIAAAAAVMTIGTQCQACSSRKQQKGKQATRGLPSWAVNCIAGAVGECGGQFFLYPVETIKILCHQSGKSARATFAALAHQHTLSGAVGRLFHGITGTMAVSAILGAAYLSLFRCTTVLFTDLAPAHSPPPAPFHPPTLPAPVFVHHESAECQPDSSSGGDVAVGTRAAHSNGGTVARGASPRGVVLSALATSFAIALLTGPIEMARNRLQAGVVKGNLLTYTMSARGFRDVAPFLGPFCLTAVPHDFAELCTVYAGGAAVDALGPVKVRREVLDAMVGGAAGAFGVFLSSPADCIKTKVLTMSWSTAFVRASANPAALLAAGTGVKWRAAARHTLRTQGLAGLFVGVWPRLVDEVPGSMLHWSLVEACYRWLGHGDDA